jgi:hypothetical protein
MIAEPLPVGACVVLLPLPVSLDAAPPPPDRELLGGLISVPRVEPLLPYIIVSEAVVSDSTELDPMGLA